MGEQSTDNENNATTSEVPVLTQATYKPGGFVISAWDLIGERVENFAFEPLGVQVVGRSSTMVDLMFADYGGLPKETGPLRKHLSSGSAADEMDTEENEGGKRLS